MRIKIKFPHDVSRWPIDYLGKEVEVEVDQLRFPNGTQWCVGGDSFNIEPEQEKQAAPVASLKDVIGYLPAKITIESHP